MQNKTIRLLFLGDLSGPAGVAMFEKWAPQLKAKHSINAIVVNGENTAKNGRGITPQIVQRLIDAGASVITSGNHIWANKKIYSFIDESSVLIRPANYPSSCPGKGYSIFEVNGVSVAVISVQGRVFMHDDLGCPFRTVESLLMLLSQKTNVVFVDFHAEATSEKQAMRHFLDGKVTGVYGTHTHVPTADEQILPSGTSYITDLGFAGAIHSSLGINQDVVLDRFLNQMPVLFKVETRGPMIMTGIWVDVDVASGKTVAIERIKVIDNEIETTLG